MHRLLLAGLLAAASLGAQVFDASHAGDLVRLQGEWRFHLGDDPVWARPEFDDSQWRRISSAESWDEQGLQSVRGFMWLRTSVRLPDSSDSLGVFAIEPGPYELFINGKNVGTYGRFPPRDMILTPFPRVYAIPSGSKVISIVLRYWITPIYNRLGSLASSLAIGPLSVLKRAQDEELNERLVQLSPDFVLLSLQTILGLTLLLLFWLQRDRLEYVFLALGILALVANGIGDAAMQMLPFSPVGHEYIDSVTSCLAAICIIEFVFRFLQRATPVWFRIYQGLLAVQWIGLMAVWGGLLPPAVINTVFLALYIPYWFVIPGLLLWRFARGNKEAGLLAIPLFLLQFSDMVAVLSWLLFQLHLRSTTAPILPSLYVGNVAVTPFDLGLFSFDLGVAALILARFQKTRVEQARAQAELEAARSMQEVMVPSSITAPGFRIESVYLPAQEVGGDFFQLLPGHDGSVLVVIGDVSGKGLKAAMLVSMIIGLLRSTVEQTRSPSRILTDLNRLLAGQTDEKFATCCCALLHADGSLTGANAGHLSPYCDGEEVELPNGLPLGLIPDAEYQEITISSRPGQRWVFLSDGVIEARNKAGELYGFDRTRTISIQAVEQIAHAARDFGQEDDITVLGIVGFA